MYLALFPWPYVCHVEYWTEPLEEPREILVYNPHKITRDIQAKQLEIVKETKRYKLVFEKCMVDPKSFKSFPYRYTQVQIDDIDMENVNILLTF